MSLTTLLDQIAGRHYERRQSRKADYRSLVAAIADGKDPDPELVEQILADNGMTLEDLRTAVELLTKRRELRRAVDQQSKLTREREQIDKQVQLADAELTAAEQRHQEAIHPLLCRRDEIRDALFEAERAKRELERTCADEDLLSELASTAVTLAKLRTHSAELERSIAERRQRAADLYDAAEQAPNSREGSTRDKAVARAEATELRARAKHNETQVPGLERQLATIRQEITVTECEESTLRDRLLVP
jgi:chromosome segregation ATPase